MKLLNQPPASVKAMYSELSPNMRDQHAAYRAKLDEVVAAETPHVDWDAIAQRLGGIAQ